MNSPLHSTRKYALCILKGKNCDAKAKRDLWVVSFLPAVIFPFKAQSTTAFSYSSSYCHVSDISSFATLLLSFRAAAISWNQACCGFELQDP